PKGAGGAAVLAAIRAPGIPARSDRLVTIGKHPAGYFFGRPRPRFGFGASSAGAADADAASTASASTSASSPSPSVSKSGTSSTAAASPGLTFLSTSLNSAALRGSTLGGGGCSFR